MATFPFHPAFMTTERAQELIMLHNANRFVDHIQKNSTKNRIALDEANNPSYQFEYTRNGGTVPQSEKMNQSLTLTSSVVMMQNHQREHMKSVIKQERVDDEEKFEYALYVPETKWEKVKDGDAVLDGMGRETKKINNSDQSLRRVEVKTGQQEVAMTYIDNHPCWVALDEGGEIAWSIVGDLYLHIQKKEDAAGGNGS